MAADTAAATRPTEIAPRNLTQRYVRWIDAVFDIERSDDAPAIDVMIRHAFREQPGVADMVVAIRGSAQYEPGLTLVARRAARWWAW